MAQTLMYSYNNYFHFRDRALEFLFLSFGPKPKDRKKTKQMTDLEDTWALTK